jgi:hypothetical protein
MTTLQLIPGGPGKPFSMQEILAANVRVCGTPGQHPYLCLCPWIIRAEAEAITKEA